MCLYYRAAERATDGRRTSHTATPGTGTTGTRRQHRQQMTGTGTRGRPAAPDPRNLASTGTACRTCGGTL